MNYKSHQTFTSISAKRPYLDVSKFEVHVHCILYTRYKHLMTKIINIWTIFYKHSKGDDRRHTHIGPLLDHITLCCDEVIHICILCMVYPFCNDIKCPHLDIYFICYKTSIMIVMTKAVWTIFYKHSKCNDRRYPHLDHIGVVYTL